MSSNNIFVFLVTYIKISKNWSVKYYRNNNERLQKKLVKDIKVKWEKTPSQNFKKALVQKIIDMLK